MSSILKTFLSKNTQNIKTILQCINGNGKKSRIRSENKLREFGKIKVEHRITICSNVRETCLDTGFTKANL
jgi:ribosomal protein L9